jgi:hypothetical protein
VLGAIESKSPRTFGSAEGRRRPAEGFRDKGRGHAHHFCFRGCGPIHLGRQTAEGGWLYMFRSQGDSISMKRIFSALLCPIRTTRADRINFHFPSRQLASWAPGDIFVFREARSESDGKLCGAVFCESRKGAATGGFGLLARLPGSKYQWLRVRWKRRTRNGAVDG